MREIITLNLQKSESAYSPTKRLRVRRGDDRSLRRTFQILDADEPVDLSTKSVSFMCENAGGAKIMDAVTVQDASGQFTYALPTAVAAYIGTCKNAYFRVECDEYIGTTDALSIEVLGDVSLTDDVTGDYVPLLDQIEEAAEELALNAGMAAEEAAAAVNSCQQATATANSAAESANAEALAAKEAAEGAENAAASANSAAEAADNAASTANSAADAASSNAQQASTAASRANEAAAACEAIVDYTVPVMSESTRGGAKLGEGLDVTDGVLSAMVRMGYETVDGVEMPYVSFDY